MNLNKLIAERQKTHGPFDTYAAVATGLKAVVRPHLESAPPAVKEGLDMIFSKIARVATGDPVEPDHWVDIQGYAKAVETAIHPLKPRKAVKPKAVEADQLKYH